VLFLAGKGEGTIAYYEVVNEAPWIHFLGKHVSNDPQVGVAVYPKDEYDVVEVEIKRMFKLTTTLLEPISFTVPRTRKEYFQDDIYTLTRSSYQPAADAEEWFSGKNVKAKKVDLCPPNMKPLSTAPLIKRQSKYNFDEELKRGDDGPTTKEQVLGKFYSVVTEQWKEAGPTPDEQGEGVDADEWDD